MKLINLVSMLLLTAASAAVATTTIYSWTDDNGVVHFSDTPGTQQANTVELSVTEVQQNIQTTVIDSNQADNIELISITTDTEAPLPAATVSLLAPVHQQTIRSNDGDIKVRAVSNRKLNKKLQAQLVIDGKVNGTPQTDLTWQLTNIDRGSHQIQIQLLNNGKILASSESITVYLHRVSQARPKNSPIQPR
ncbi:DUF4124 domain-containing protein [Photobacterium carnosum]|uniref:DUF4124 domain-containing protein n=1 Tax=Photobacterium carnosum TaxID=2023717 RepID=UPI001E2BE603|nr:DUF4124 domain-containing protein [Photobacterium carnosum]MCD9515692.1 DUF4124 domain-containing protein [Photobacterium carnosum]MCD9530795.1 DUF4124 domain-containing protein [Photobacterium carnosum]MCF2154675.1 DUF4124 domain-containing protein [Photobacterium carnosum]MCF2216613.1 DUF4124 domain-containing protein [Photobacterium carnosum]